MWKRDKYEIYSYEQTCEPVKQVKSSNQPRFLLDNKMFLTNMKVCYLPVKAKACLKLNLPHSRYDVPVAWQHEIECCSLNGVQCMLMPRMTCPALPHWGVKGHQASKAVHRGQILQTELTLLLFCFPSSFQAIAQ